MTTLLMRPSRDKRPYRLRCRFKIDARPSRSRLEVEKVRIAERFVSDLHKQGWENLPSYGFKLRGPFPMVVPVTIKVPRKPTAREMESAVLQGARFLDNGRDYAKAVPKLHVSEYWEFEISGVFAREEIQVEYADRHEEEHL